MVFRYAFYVLLIAIFRHKDVLQNQYLKHQENSLFSDAFQLRNSVIISLLNIIIIYQFLRVQKYYFFKISQSQGNFF